MHAKKTSKEASRGQSQNSSPIQRGHTGTSERGRQLFLASASAAALIAVSAGAADAQSWTGAVSSDWTNGANWTGGVAPTNGVVTINTTLPNPAVVGVSGAAVATSGPVVVGDTTSGALAIQSGSTLTSNANAFSTIGTNGGTGVVSVTGSGSRWTYAGVPGLVSVVLGNFSGTGTLNVSNGGSVVTAGDLVVGERSNGIGFLSVTSGGTVTTGRDAYIARRIIGTSQGTATVTGAGSSWTIAARLFVANGGTGTLNIADNARVTVATLTTVADSGGSGTLNISGGGTLETPSLSRTVGNTAQVNFDGGVLRATANNASFITSFTGNELNLQAGGLTLDTQGFNVTAASPLSGVGGLTKTGAGALTLSAANTYTGQTLISTGTLALTGAGSVATSSRVIADGTFDISAIAPAGANIRSLAGSGTVTLGARNLTITAANDTFSGVIGGTGALAIGGGAQVLTGANTYGGGTTISAGTLQLGNGSATGSIQGDVLNNGALTFNRNNSYLFTGQISGTGALNQTGTGTTILTSDTTYAGGTTISAGTLQLGNGGGTGSILGDVVNNGTLAFSRSNDYEFSGQISGTGAVQQINTGRTILTADNTYTGQTTIAAGTLQLGNGGTSGAVIGDILNNATLSFNRSDAFVVPGVISGAGAVTQDGTGTTVLTGNNTYTGGTTINSGTLQLGNGGTSGSIVGNVTNNATMAFNRSDTMAFGGIISGAGSIRQIGSGLTNLTGDSSGFAGTTSVEAGTLAVNGSLCGNMNVLAGGRLQGNGTVCDTTNFAGGAIAPGNSIGTITVAGNYVGNGGLLEIETVLGGDASPTDRLVVTGDTAGSTNVRVIKVGGTGALTVEGIKIVDIGGASNGTFTLLGDYTFLGQSAVIAGAYAYVLQKNGVSTPNDGDWYLRSSSTTPTPPPVPGEPPPPAPLPGPIFAPTVPVYESYARVMLSLNELPTMQQRIGHRFRSGPDAMASIGVAGASVATFSPLWARVEGGHKNLNPVATARSTLDIDHYKFEGGADLVNVETGAGRWLVGVVGNYVEGNADVHSLFGDGRIRVTGGGVGGTATWLGDAGFYFDGQVRASWYSGDLRSLAVGPIISGNDGTGYAFGAEVGHRLGIGGGWSITPQVQVNYSNVEYDDFTDRFGALVSLRNGESLLGRGGFSINHQHSWRDAAGRLVRSDVYGIANAYYEFMNGNTTLVSDTAFASSLDRLWGSIGAGGTFSWADDKYALYGEVSYRSSLNQPGDSYSYRGTAGFRVRW